MLVRNANRVDPDQKQSELGRLFCFGLLGKHCVEYALTMRLPLMSIKTNVFTDLRKLSTILLKIVRYIIDILKSNSRDIVNILILLLFFLIFR